MAIEEHFKTHLLEHLGAVVEVEIQVLESADPQKGMTMGELQARFDRELIPYKSGREPNRLVASLAGSEIIAVASAPNVMVYLPVEDSDIYQR